MNYLATKPIQKSKLRLCISNVFILILLFLFPFTAFSQKQKDIIPILECVEDLGDGKFLANYGYDNPNGMEITVPDTNSVLIYNNGNTKEKTINKFKSGRQYKVIIKEFNGGDTCIWRIELPNGTTKNTGASVNSSHCSPSFNIEQYYPAPAGGKLNNSLISPELNALYKLNSTGKDVSSDDIFQLSEDEDSVLIEIFPVDQKSGELLDLLQSADYGLTESYVSTSLIKGYFPISNLLKLNKLPKLIVYATTVASGITNGGTITTQGDISQRSDFVRGGYSLFGADVKIGVISNSFNTKGLNYDQLKEELLENVIVKKDLKTEATDEGRAMLEIIRDIAPAAKLYFRTGVRGPEDMAAGIHELADEGCDVIVDDVTYITEPFFSDGQVAQAVDDVVNNNKVTYFTSAGNFGSASYISETFNPVPSPKGITGVAHDFGGGDIFQNIKLEPGTYTLVLQWDEPIPALTDLDIYLTEVDGANLLGYNHVNTGAAPIEVLPFTVSGGGATTNIMITRASGTATPRFKYIVFRGSTGFKINEYGIEGASTITGQANSIGAITVGAVRFDKSPAFNKSLKIMSYSSTGIPSGELGFRQKPDITAPNGVNTSVDLGSGDWDDDDANQPGIDPDIFPNFFGTSAAAPHAAAVAALLINANKKYNYDPDIAGAVAIPLDPDTIRSKLMTTALDDDSITGIDYISGAGFIQADAAMALIALPNPTISGIVPDTVIQGGKATFIVIGNYFAESSKIFCRGIEIPTTFNSPTELKGTIAVFEGNPIIHVETEAISLSGLDGGITDTISFSQEPKMKVSVLVENEERMFGQGNPVFTYSFHVTAYDENTDGYTIEVNDPPLLDTYMLSLIDFNAPSPTADIGIWGINAILTGQIPNAVNELYEFAYEDLPDPVFLKPIFKRVDGYGLLTINKLPVTIQANDLTGDDALTYGSDILGASLTFNYDFGDANLSDEEKAAVLNILTNIHGDPAKQNGLALVKGITLQNGLPVINGSTINNGIQLISGLAIVDGWEIDVIVGSGDITMSKDGVINTISYSDLQTDGYTFINELSFYNGHLIVNAKNIEYGLAIVNGRDKQTGLAIVNEVSIVKNEDGEKFIAEVDGVSYTPGLAIVDGVPLIGGLAIVDGATIEVTTNGKIVYQGLAIVDGADIDEYGNGMLNKTPVIAGLPIVNTSQIISGLAMVNCNLNGAPTASGLAIINGALASADGLAIVNDAPTDEVTGLPMVNGVPVVDGLAIINGVPIADGLAIVNGVGLAIVNGKSTADGLAIVNDGLAIVNGVPAVTGLAIINGSPDVTGLALVNGSAFTGGLAIVNSDGEVITNSPVTANGLALVNAVGGTEYVQVNNLGLLSAESALLNSQRTIDGLAIVDAINHNNSSGLAIVNGVGLAIVNQSGEYGLAIVNKVVESGLAIVNAKAMAEGLAIVNGAPIIEGLAIVNGTSSIEGLAIVNGTPNIDGLAIVNGGAEGLAIVNGLPAVQEGVIMIMDITALQSNEEIDEPVKFVPVSMITGTTAGEHWIIPAALNSINFEPTYLPAKVEIKKKNVNVDLSNLTPTYDGKPKQPSTGDLDLNVHFTYTQGENPVLYPTDAGTYQVTATIIDENYEGIASDISFTIREADLTVVNTDRSKVYGVVLTDADYTGSITGIQADDNITITRASTGDVADATVAGSTYLIVGTLIDPDSRLANYTVSNPNGALTVTKANLTVVNTDRSKVYGLVLKDAEYTGSITGIQADDNITITRASTGDAADATVAGSTYLIVGTLIDPDSRLANYTVSNPNGALTVTKANLTVVNTDRSKVYGVVLKDAEYTGSITGIQADDNITITRASTGDAANATVAGSTYRIVGTLIDPDSRLANYTVSNSDGALTVTKASLTIVADIGYKNQGDPEPELTSLTIGLIPGDNISVTLVREAGDEARVDPYLISLDLETLDLGNNYTLLEFIPASFYINPWGPGTKKIRSTLMCVSENLDEGTSTAIFAWNNDNSVPVYVPHGENNYFDPNNVADIADLPELFPQGSGVFSVTYSGSTLTWTINSYESDHKSSTTTGANLSSPKCTDNKSARITEGMVEPDLEASDLKVYPNPTSGRVTINFRNKPGADDITVLDILGRTQQLEKTWIPSSGLELDLSGVVSGVYLIKIHSKKTIKTFRIIKQ